MDICIHFLDTAIHIPAIGSGSKPRDAYLALDPKKRDSVVAFLCSLVIEATLRIALGG